MKNFCCEKCGSIDVFLKESGSQTGLYCGDCGKWIKWVPKNEIELVKRFIEDNKKSTTDTVLEKLCKAVSDHLFNNPHKYSPYIKAEITGTNIDIVETIKGIPVKRYK